jgi:hypothetical protein
VRTVRICGRLLFTPAALFVVLTACAAFTRAQETARAQARSPRTIVLPQQSVAGLPATLAVLDSAGRVLPNVVVEISSGQKVTTDSTGRALFAVPDEPGVLTAQIPGHEVRASAPVVKMSDAAPPTSLGDPSAAVRVLAVPHFISLHDRFAVRGAGFRVEAESNHVYLSGQPCLVLASSPISLVGLPGLRVPLGTIRLDVSVAGHEAQAKSVTVVLLELAGPAEAPQAGAQSKLSVRVHGTGERLAIEVLNFSPEIIRFPRGKVERLTSSGGESNTAEIETKFLASGDYVVTARLIPTDFGLPDLEAARQKLVAARALATGAWAERADRVIRRIDRDPQDVANIRSEIEQMLHDKPSGEFALLLESAWKEFQRNN